MRDTPADSDLEVDERERLLIEAVVTLARALRDERDRLAKRLREVENELHTLTIRLAPLKHPKPSYLDARTGNGVTVA